MKNSIGKITGKIGIFFLLFIVSFFSISCNNADTKHGKFDINTPEINSLSVFSEGIKIYWDEIEGVSNYRVFRKTESEDWTIIGYSKETSFVDKDVTKDISYTYTIRCLDESGEKYISDYDDVGKTVVFVVYDTPVLSSISTKSDGIEVCWEAVEGAGYYRVFRKEEGGKWGKIGDTDELVFLDKKVENGKKYVYTVRCLNQETNEYLSDYDSKGLAIEFVHYDHPNLSKVQAIKGGIKITWKEVKGVTQYRVFRKQDEGSWEKIADTTSNVFIDGDAKKGNTYIYTVRCLSEDGKSYLSDYDKKGLSIDYQ